jgi:Protein of unknown function (DUF3617)
MKFLSLIFAAVVVLSVPAAMAQSPEPGLWQTTVKMQMTDFLGRPTGTQDLGTLCVTAEMAGDPAKGFKPEVPRGTQDCKYTGNWTGSQLTYEMTCGGGQESMIVKGAYTFESPVRFRGTGSVTSSAYGQRMQMTMQMEGQRVGECPR